MPYSLFHPDVTHHTEGTNFWVILHTGSPDTFRWHLTLAVSGVIHITVNIFLSNIASISSSPFFLDQFEKLSITASLRQMCLQRKVMMLCYIKQDCFTMRRGHNFAASSCWLVAKKNGCTWPTRVNCARHECKCRQRSRYSAFDVFCQSA